MAKKQQKKKKVVKALRSKLERLEKGKKEVKMNPFDFRINHERHSVLGRKSKHDRGMPGLSQNKAMQKRKAMMLKRQLLTHKSNSFIDKRIGEYDHTSGKEDQIVARLTYERQKKHKSNIYNLNDDEELTHLGKPIKELNTFDDPFTSDDDDDDDKLDANFVKEAHFGGFLFKKSDQDSSKTHKELVNDMIVESKIRKQERKMEREKNEDLTEKLDKEWKEVHLLMPAFKTKEEQKSMKSDQYDKIVKELKFEPRGTPSSRLKTPKELENEEKKRLNKLEQARLSRMLGPVDKISAHDQFISPDSIYDGLEIEEVIDTSATNATDNLNEDQDDSSLKMADSITFNDSVNISEDESKDLYSDLDSGSEDDEPINEENEICDSIVINSEFKNLLHSVTFPKNVGEMLSLTSGKSAEEQLAIISHLIKCNHPSLGQGNREKMELLFKVLLEYCNHICNHETPCCLKVIDILVPHVYLLAHLSPYKTSLIFRDILLQSKANFENQQTNSAFNRNIPCLGDLVILKFCSILYSTSDFRHPVVTVAMLFMSEILVKKFVITYNNIVSRLFVSNLFYEFVSYSKRFVPEAIAFVQVILFLAAVKDSDFVKSFKDTCLETDKNLLVVTSSVAYEPQKISIADFHDSSLDITDFSKINIINNAVEQLILYAELYAALPSFSELFFPVYMLCGKLPVEHYPRPLADSVEKLRNLSNQDNRKISYLSFPMKKPKPLKLFEPEFEGNYNDKKQYVTKKMKLEKDLLKKCKREEKGILREIRREAQYLGRQQLQQKIELDEERKSKVKKIYQELAMQEGECKTLFKHKK